MIYTQYIYYLNDVIASLYTLFCPSIFQVEPQAEHYNRTETFNASLFHQLGSSGHGLLGLTVDTNYGGTGWIDATAVALVHEELSYSDPAFCLAYLAHSLLLVNNLHVNANEEQKQRLLPELCAGSKIGGMGMSEPQAGTDVLGMKTTAVLDDKEWVLNGTKLWITVCWYTRACIVQTSRWFSQTIVPPF